MRPWLLMLLLPLLVHVSPAARILGINPTPSISHQLPFLIIMRALAERGHQVTIITTDPLQDAPPTMTQIDVSFTYEKWKKEVNFFYLSTQSVSYFVDYMTNVVASDCEVQFESPDMKKFIEYPGEFDVVIMELFMYWCYYGLIHKLGSPPVIGFCSAEPTVHLHRIMGNIVNPSYVPDYLSDFTDHMTFWERAVNTYYMMESFWIGPRTATPHEILMKKYFGNDVPSIETIQFNTSMLLVNNHFSTGCPKPMLPNMIQMTGLHITDKRQPLPKDVKEFLDGATHGAIYFSLGSNVKSNTLPESTRAALMDAFAELPQRVLWKFEDNTLPGKPDNVMISKWFPQQDVLAHQNVRLFITQGGLQSFNEASYFGVTLIGIPFFGDQGYNVAKIVRAGIGLKLDFSQISKASVLEAIKTVLYDPSFQENMRRYSAVYREHQSASLQDGVWWVEYVIRHRGAPHLRSAGLGLRWWQLLLVDVMALVALVCAVATLVFYKTVRWLFSYVLPRSKTSIKKKKQ